MDKDLKFKMKVTPETSKQVQEALFEAGYEWVGGGKKVKKTQEPYLFLGVLTRYGDPAISWDDNPTYFELLNLEELTPEQLFEKLGKSVSNPIGDIKVKVTPEQSRLTQEALFKLGYGWGGPASESNTEVQHLERKHLFISEEDKAIRYSYQDTDEYFSEHRYTEVLADNLIGRLYPPLKVEHEPEAEPVPTTHEPFLTLAQVIKHLAAGGEVEWSVGFGSQWQPLRLPKESEDFMISSDFDYRLAPKTKMVNGIEFPLPMKTEPEEDQKYHFVAIGTSARYWAGDEVDQGIFDDGRAFKTGAEAQAAADALAKLLKGIS